MYKLKKMKKITKKVQMSLLSGFLAVTIVPFSSNSAMPIANAATTGLDAVPDYFTTPNYANSQLPELDAKGNVIPGTGIRKFVDSLPGLGVENKNNLGQYIPVAVPDTTTYPGSDYYEISLVDYTERMHSDLPKETRLRGYKQTNSNDPNVTKPSMFGPMIIAHKDRPVRIKFTNELLTGSGGDLFLPVDTSLMGAGMGPDGVNMYTQNRATLHLHGGITPWISDGTPHQWITPAGENTPYPQGVSVKNVPDMPDPGPGSMTFYYSNLQSARLMFFHDHSLGLTRLNVYAGEAGGYLLRDQVEEDLIALGVIPKDEIPLLIQDKTFVPSVDQLAATDPTWDTEKWGKPGDLWFPHVYMPNQNPYDMSGANPYGRWDYGPWFWPPNTGLKNGPVDNPLYGKPGQPPKMPGVPNVSTVPEAFMDTPVINGTAYPTLTVEPKAYRFRILNASNDRMWNLQLYKAVSSNQMWKADGTLNDANAGEVPMVDAVKKSGYPATWPSDGRDGGVPDPNAAGPVMYQIGNESGFLPQVAELASHPVNYDYNRRSITVLNVTDKTLFLAPAERADVVVDFSEYAGKTLILYNDAPAPVPAFDPRLDYYTGDPDQSVNGNDTGGAPTTQPGYGPNTRTIMQITVAKKMADGTLPQITTGQTLQKLKDNLPTAFAKGQNPKLIPDGKWVNIHDNNLTFTPNGGTELTLQFNPKAIAEEFEQAYGRMNSTLGVELPNTNFQNQTTIMLGYIDPATENLQDSMTPMTPVAGDGTQIWKITHNGVDTHGIHFHLFDVQLINRVGWDGSIRMPDANEMGWKDTVRMNPLEDCIVALRPIAPKMPFGVPDSIRLLDPTMPEGSTMGFMGVDPLTGNPVQVKNVMTNFLWEYVWHCHLLGHEENDMMRPITFNVERIKPNAAVLTDAARDQGGVVKLAWTDPTPASDPQTLGNPTNEIGFRVIRALLTDGQLGVFNQIGTTLANQTTFTDPNVDSNSSYVYRIDTYNATGETASNLMEAQGTPLAPNNLNAVQVNSQVNLTWSDLASNETGYTVERSNDGGNNYSVIGNTGTFTGTGSFTDTNPQSGENSYRVKAVNGSFESPYSNAVVINFTVAPAAPTNLTASQSGSKINLSWNDNANNETGFIVERSNDGGANFSVVGTPGAFTGTGIFTDANPLAGTNIYRVKAVNNNVESSYSNNVSINFVVAQPPAAPSNLTGSLQAGPKVNLSWRDNATNETGFAIERSTNGGAFAVIANSGAKSSTGTVTYTDSTVAAGNIYTYRIAALNGVVFSSYSNTFQVNLTIPDVPTSLLVSKNGNSGAVLSWSENSTVTGYVVQYAKDANFTSSLKTVTTTNKSVQINGLSKNTTYYFRVQAVNSIFTSTWSSYVQLNF